MIKILTSVTTFNDAVGTRMSVSYSEVDETTGKIISDNKRADKLVLEPSTKATIAALNEYAQAFVDSQ